MASALNRDSELALLLSGEASLADWLDTTIYVDVALQSFSIAIIEVKVWIIF